jgi:hypothetical protein
MPDDIQTPSDPPVRVQPVVSLSLDDAKAIFRLTENCEAPYWIWNGGAMMACQRLLEAINDATGQANDKLSD